MGRRNWERWYRQVFAAGRNEPIKHSEGQKHRDATPPRKNVNLSKFLLVRLYRKLQRKKRKSLRSRTEQGNLK